MRRQLVISLQPDELATLDDDMQALGISNRSEFFLAAIMDAVAVRRAGKVQVALSPETVIELDQIVSKPARRLLKQVGEG